MPKAILSPLRVRYAETDAQQVVYHANYLVYFEVGRGDFLRAVGVDYNAMEASGAFVVVVEANVRYHSPARYDDELVVHTWLDEVRTRSMRFGYKLTRGTGEAETILASGWTAHVVVNREGRPIPIPEALRQAIADAGLAPEGRAPEAPKAEFKGDAVISPQA
ncbi:Acyl-CoA thioester hydrolase YbgC [compost metagenome]